MLAELRLVLAPKEARLTVRHGDGVVEDEVWTFDRKVDKSEAKSIVSALFADAYDLMQHVTYGDE